MNRAAHDKLVRARAAMILSQPFFAALALHLEIVERPDIETMAVDGRHLFYAPDFVLECSNPELQGIVAHETMHCAYDHITRRNGRDHDEWNAACDYAINRDLLAAGFKLPDGALHDPQYDGMGAEEIFAARARQRQQGGGGQQSAGGGGQSQGGKSGQSGKPQSGQPGNGPQAGATAGGNDPASKPLQGGGRDPGRCGAVLDAAPASDSAANAQASAQWQARVRQAVAVAKAQGAGKIPGDLERIVKALAAPRVDWRALLRRFVDKSQSRDYSWMRPNRRHIAAGRYFPGYVPDRPAHIVALVDTSGSISDADAAAFSAELQAVLDEGAADKLTVACADTRVQRHSSYDPGEVIELNAQGGGGTSFVQPLQWVAEHCPDASAILYLTDCDCGDAWGTEPAAPLMWIVTGNANVARRYAARAPFGESVILAE